MSFLTPAGIIPLYENLEILERGLNVFGYIPIVGTFTGSLGRGTLSVAQAVAGFALGFFYIFFTSGNPLAAFYGSVAVTMIKHAFLNGIRRQFEIRPFAPLLFLLPIDILFGRVFPYPV